MVNTLNSIFIDETRTNSANSGYSLGLRGLRIETDVDIQGADYDGRLVVGTRNNPIFEANSSGVTINPLYARRVYANNSLGSANYVLKTNGNTVFWAPTSSSGGSIANDSITFAQIQNISNSHILARYSGGTGDIEQYSVWPFMMSLLTSASGGEEVRQHIDLSSSDHVVFNTVRARNLAGEANIYIDGLTSHLHFQRNANNVFLLQTTAANNFILTNSATGATVFSVTGSTSKVDFPQNIQVSGIELDPGAVLNWDSGNVTVTQSAGLLSLLGRQTITSAHANAFDVGPNGSTNPTFSINSATISAATGFQITGAAAGGRVSIAAISSGTNEGLNVDAKGSGTIRLGTTSTGAVEFSRNAVPTTADGAALGTNLLRWSDLFLASGAVINFDNGNVTITHSAASITVVGALMTFQRSGAQCAYVMERTDAHGAGAVVTRHGFWGRDSATNAELYGRMDCYATDNTSTSEDGTIVFGVVTAGTFADELNLNGTALFPVTNDGLAIGTATASWADLFLASGAVINFNNGDVTVTHSSNALTGTGGQLLWDYNAGATTTPFSSTNSSDTQFNIAGVFRSNRATPAALDAVYVDFQMNDSALNATTMARFLVYGLNVTNGAETGRLDICLASAGTPTVFYNIEATYIRPNANDGASLGIAALSWSDLFLASGGVINWNNGVATLTHNSSSAELILTSSATNSITASVGASGYGAFYARGSGTNNSYVFLGNVTNSERARITADNSRNMSFSTDGGTTSTTIDSSGNWVFPGTSVSRIARSTDTGGTLTTASRNRVVVLATAPTIPASTFTADDFVWLYNNTSSSMTVTQGGGGTQRLTGTATTGNLTLAQRGWAKIYFISTTEWVIEGVT